MTASELLEHYAGMFRAARERPMTLLQEDGTLSEYRRVVQRIERRLEADTASEDDVAQLKEIAGLFRAAKAKERAA